ncbi:MAG: hypothetical protein Kow00114_16040 [Kiloniellaceae bacterium]
MTPAGTARVEPATIAVFTRLVLTNYLCEEPRHEQIRGAFRYYLSPVLVGQLANEPDRLVLGGERRDMTVPFSDVRGFTTISENMKDQLQRVTRSRRPLSPLSRRSRRILEP